MAAEGDCEDDHEDEDDYENGDEDDVSDATRDNVDHPDPSFEDIGELQAADDPWNDVDDTSSSVPLPKRRRSPSPTFEQVVGSAKMPHKGAHRRRPAKPHRLVKKHAAANLRRQKKRLETKQQRGHIPAASTVRDHVQPAIPLATDLNTSALPSTLGAYAGKAEDAKEKYGSRVRRSLANLLGLGFHVLEWDGMCAN